MKDEEQEVRLERASKAQTGPLPWQYQVPASSSSPAVEEGTPESKGA